MLDRFPLLRKLKLREVAQVKALTGHVSDANRGIMVDPRNFPRSLETPYIEAGVGIENILKFGRIDVIKRLTHVYQPESVFDMIRYSLFFTF